MAKSTALDTSILGMIFNGLPIANLCDNAASAPLTNLWIGLHRFTPTVSGDQTVGEATYTGYARVAVPRNSSGFVISGPTVTLAALLSFPTCTLGSETETFFSVGVAASGTSEVLYLGPISPSIIVAPGITPQLAATSSITEN